MFFDTHAHYDDPQFDGDREALLAALPQRGVGLVVNCGSDVTSSARSVALSEQFPHLYAAVGIHPEAAGDCAPEALEAVARLCRREKVVAVGEIGLDYHYPDGASRERQIAVLRDQLALALELDLPVVIHDREAHGDCLQVVKDFAPRLRGVFHCYSGSVELARELAALGWMFSFGGAATFKNARKLPEVIADLPADRLMLETDCPYLAPVPYRGSRCDSTMLPETCAAVARFRGMTPEAVMQLTWDNACRFFRIPALAE